MTIFDDCFPLGLGTLRLPMTGAEDETGFERSVELVCRALDKGINYIDTSYTYISGQAQPVLKEAFRRAGGPCGVTVKVLYGYDTTADETRRRVELQLEMMGLEKARYFVCWTVRDYAEFENIMKPGGVYDGALKLVDEGLVEHLCFSSHCSPADAVRILESGAFEGVTISYSLLNAVGMQPVLQAAQCHNIGVAAMNPLGGGIIAKNQAYFDFARMLGDNDVPQAALRFIHAHPAIQVVLSGVSSLQELESNCASLQNDEQACRSVARKAPASEYQHEQNERDEQRLKTVIAGMSDLKDFCTGCGYCKGCPQDIEISSLMQKRNNLIFEPGLDDREQSMHIFCAPDETWIPSTPDNPCIRCGACERSCTQHLAIIKALDDIYRRVSEGSFSLPSRREKLRALLNEKDYTRVGLCPSGGFANMVMRLYRQFFGEPSFEWVQFNGDDRLQGEFSGGLPIHSTRSIEDMRPDIILVGTIRYADTYYEALKHYQEQGIVIQRFNEGNEIPWVY